MVYCRWQKAWTVGALGMNCRCDEVPDNTSFNPTALPVRVCLVQSGGKATLKDRPRVYYMGSKNPSLMLSWGSTFHHCPQATCGHDQQRYCNVVTIDAAWSAAHTPIQSVHFIQAGSWIVYSRLVVMPQPHREPRSRNIRHEHKCTQHKQNSTCPHMYIFRRHKSSNRRFGDAQKA